MSGRFPHHRLHAYALAVELAVQANEICAGIPRGQRHLADQLLRSGSGVALLVAEGANRFSAAQKRQRFVEARGECGEAAATVELLGRLGSVGEVESSRFEETADRVAALLTGLIRRCS